MFGREFRISFPRAINQPSSEDSLINLNPNLIAEAKAFANEMADRAAVSFIVASVVIAGLVTASAVIINEMNPANHN